MRKKWSDEDIASLAIKLRKALNLPDWQQIDVADLATKLQRDSRPAVRIDFEECSSGYLKGFAAKARPKERKVSMIYGLWQKLIKGDSHAAAIILEEIGHIFMHPEAMTIDHADGIDVKAANHPEFAEMEEEAQKFVFYTFAPIEEVYSWTDAERLVKQFGMPLELAKGYIDHLRSTRVWTQLHQHLIAKMYSIERKLVAVFSKRVASLRMSFILQKKRSTMLRLA